MELFFEFFLKFEAAFGASNIEFPNFFGHPNGSLTLGATEEMSRFPIAESNRNMLIKTRNFGGKFIPIGIFFSSFDVIFGKEAEEEKGAENKADQIKDEAGKEKIQGREEKPEK